MDNEAKATTHERVEEKASTPLRSLTDNSAKEASSEESAWWKINGTLIAWLVFLTFGGGLLALYYARIDYLPDIEWSASIVYLAVASIIGGGVGGLFALSLFVPGFIWGTFLVFDRHLADTFCYRHINKEPCFRAIWRNIGRPFFVVVLISHLCLLLSLLKSLSLPDSCRVPLGCNLASYAAKIR